MNSSSGIKRGLAATAVAALAVTGIPALASSASATPGETMTFVSAGPTLNGGDVGGVVRLKVSSTVDAGDEADLTVTNTNLNGTPNNGNQTVDLVGETFVANGTAGDSNPTDGLDEIVANVAVTTSDVGATANYALYLDDDGDGVVDASEARVQVSQSTSGPLASIAVEPASQSAAQGITSGDYTATVKDSAGRTTQLMAADDVAVTIAPDGSVSDASLDATELELGSATFTAQAPTTGTKTITLNPSSLTDPTGNATATLNVTKAAVITAPEVDIVTGADDWHGFGNNGNGGTPLATNVRVDQGSVRIDFKSADPVNDANSTVTLNIDGGAGPAPAGITFGGKRTITVSTVLDANGVGSITITPDAFTVQEGNQIAITGSFTQTLTFQRAAAAGIQAGASMYFGQLKGSVDVTATVVDQFGDPFTTGFVGAQRTAGPNADAAPQLKPVGAGGVTTFTITDKAQVNNGVDVVGFAWYPDQFAAVPGATGGTQIKWTTTGQGADFNTTLEGHDTGAAGYKASDVTIIPLADANVSVANEAADLAIAGGEAGVPVTVSVDHGALILAPGESTLAEGSASVDTTLPGGNLPAGYQIIGTTSGLVNVTIKSANRTEMTQMTVAAQTDTATARNVAVSGPAEVESGSTQIAYTAVITDAFGNGIGNIPVQALNIQVTGPAEFQDSDATTNAAGQITLNVRVDADAVGDVTIKVTGLNFFGNQFGAAANRLTAASNTNDAPGLAVSSNVATATTTVNEGTPTKVDPELALSGSSKSGKDKIKADAIDEAAGATATLWVNGDKKKTGTLNSSGNFTFSIKDKNGSKKTKYVVKVGGTALTTKAQASISQK